MIKYADTDGDGSVSGDELLKILRNKVQYMKNLSLASNADPLILTNSQAIMFWSF